MAPTRVDMGDGIEIKFAQKLAGNEKEGRDKALRKLKKWIKLKSCAESSESAYTELELLKLWKGLFYCMWMSDKPLVQEQLAEELSQLVHLFPYPQDAVTFCSTFFTTMAREWHGIDVIRREKFMMLVRRVLRQTLSFLLPSDGGDGGALSRLTGLCEAAFVRREDPATLPLGLQLHLVEIFLEEVAKVGRDHLTHTQMAALLAPFIQVLKVSKQSTLRKTITDSVFYHLMRQSDVGILHEMIINGEAEEGSDDSDLSVGDDAAAADEEGDPVLDPRAGGVDVTLTQLKVNYGQLSDDLLSAGAEQTVRQKNRAALYRLAQQFRDLSEGKYPLTLKLPENIDSDSDISDEDMEAAVQRLQSTKQHLNRDSRKNQKEKRPRTEAEEDPQPKKKKKIKHKMLSNGVIDTGDEMMAEAENAPPEEHEEEPSEEPQEQPGARRKTLKEKRRQKLKEKREAELAKQKKKKDKLEAKRAKLNGATKEGDDMVNGAALNGDHDVGGNGEPSTLDEGGDVAIEEAQSGATPLTASKKKKKKKRVAEEDSPNVDSVPISLDDSTPTTTKKKKKKVVSEPVATDSPAPADTGVAAPVTGNGTASPPEQKKKSKKKKKSAAAEATTPSNDASPAPPKSTFDWSLGMEDNWDDAAPTSTAPAAAQKPAGKPTKKAGSAAAAAQSEVAHFVPSRPVPAFVKLRTGKKGGAAAGRSSPATPRTPGSAKKVIINLAENKAQGFKEHLITVRNSPQVPHNPNRRPVKGLLKPSPVPAATAAAGSRRRSKAADFFGV